MLKTKNNIIKIRKKINYYIKLLIDNCRLIIEKAKRKIVPFYKQSTINNQQFLKHHWKRVAIGLASLIMLSGLGFGVYKYLTTPRAPDLKPAKGGYLYSANGLDYKAFIGNKENNRPDVTFEVGGGSVVFTPASGNENPATPEIPEDKAVIFKDIYQNIDFKYQTLPLGIKEEIIINKPTPIKTFPFFLDFKNTTPQYMTDNVKGTVFFDKDNNYLFHFEKPYAFDAKGSRTDNLGISIRKDTATGKYVAIVSLDEDWMNDPSRTHPITVDPTIVHDTTLEFSTGQFDRVIDTGSGSAPNLTTKYQELPADINTVGLWHMNETSGTTTVADSSGNSNTGTSSSSTNVSTGVFGNARAFAGTSYFTTGSLKGLSTGNQKHTIEAWMYINASASTRQWALLLGGATTGNVHWYWRNTGTLESGIWNVNSCAVTPPIGSWFHFASVYDGTTMNCYINGVFTSRIISSSVNFTATTLSVAQAQISEANFNGSMDDLRISNVARTPEEIALDASRRPYSTYTSPVIDLTEAASWNSLSWNGTGFATGDGETATASATSNLVAQWNFNETSGTTAAASSGTCGSSCNGTLTGISSTLFQDEMPLTGWTSNNRRWGAGAIMFDGTNDTVLLSGNPSALSFERTNSFSISAWVKTNTSSPEQTILAKMANSAPYRGYHLGLNTSGKLRFLLINDTATTNRMGVYGNTTVNDGAWHYVTATYNGNSAASGVNLYVDGILQTKTVENDTLSATTITTTDVSIGSRNNAGFYFKGVIDAITVYNKALTTSEVLSNYNAGSIELQTRVGDTTTPNDGTWEAWRPVTNETQIDSMDATYQYNTTDSGLVSYWPMDETSGTSVADVKGSNTGTATGASINDGQFAKSRGMDGTNDTVSIANPSNFSFDRTSTFSIEAWIKKTNSTQSTIFSKMSNAAPYTGYEFAINASGQPYLLLINTWSTNALYVISTNTVTDNQWHHVAVTYSGSSTPAGVILYIDGVATSTTTSLNSLSASITNAITPYIGSRNNSAFFFSGNIDEVRVYNSTLSSTTLKQHADEGSTNADTFRPSTNTAIKMEGTGSERIQTGQMPVDAYTAGLWHMEETGGTGAYIKDSSPNANNGTPTGTGSTEGFAGKARSFNGTSSYITIGQTNLPSGAASRTLDAWVKLAAEPTTWTWALSYGTAASGQANFLGFSTDTVYYGGFGGNDLTFSVDLANYVGEWVYLSGVYNGTTAYLYINGQLVAYGDKTWNTILSKAYIGRQVNDSEYFNGYIDEVRISSIARSADSIAETYRAGRDHYLNKTISSTDLSSANKLPFYVASDRLGTYSQVTIGESAYANYEPDENTVGFWRMERSTFSTAQDESGYNNHGYINPGSILHTQYAGVSGHPSDHAGLIADFTYSTLYSKEIVNSIYFPSTSIYDYRDNMYSTWMYVNYSGTWSFAIDGDDAVEVEINGNVIASYYGAHGFCNCQTYSGTISLSQGWHKLIARHEEDGGGEGIILYYKDPDDASWKTFTASNLVGSASIHAYIPDDAYVKTSGYINIGLTEPKTGVAQGVIGKSMSFNGVNDHITVPSTPALRPTNNFTLEAWANFTDFSTERTIFSHDEDGGGDDGYGLRGQTDGRAAFSVLNSYGWDAQTILSNTVMQPGRWYHIAGVFRGSVLEIYINGQLDNSKVVNGGAVYSVTTNLNIGRRGGTALPNTIFMKGFLDEVRISNTPRTADEIRQAYEIGARTHNITIDFKAKLNSGNLITGSSDTSFTIDETAYGSSAMANHIFLGDKIIVKENYDGTEYIAQGTVNSVNSSTGAITVTSWGPGSTFPASGYTVNATVFKWQREYFDLTGSLSTQRNAVIRLTYRISDGSMGGNIWLDDIRSSGGYLTNPFDSEVASSTGKQYFQYRAILSQNNIYTTSPSLTSVTLDYENNYAPNTPSLDSPTNGALNQPPYTVLKTTATDFESNNLQYKIELCKDASMSVSCQTFNQTVSQTGWSGQNADGGTTYTSGTQATYTLQSALELNTTYYWRSYAIDSAGSNTWSATQATPYSFATTAAPLQPTNLLTQGQINPNNVATLTPYFSAIHNDPDGDGANYYQILVSSTPDFSSTLWNSGKVSMTATANGARSPDITYSGSALSWGATYYWKIKFWDVNSTESPYSELAHFITDSAAGSCRIQETASDGLLTVVWTDNATTETGYEVQRSVDGGAFSILQTGLPANTTSYADNTTTSSHTYQYKIAPLYSGTPGNWCTTQTLTLQTGIFSVGGLDIKGVDLR